MKQNDQTPIQWAIDVENIDQYESEEEVKSVSVNDYQNIDKDIHLRKAIFANRGKKFGRFTDEELVLITNPKIR